MAKNNAISDSDEDEEIERIDKVHIKATVKNPVNKKSEKNTKNNITCFPCDVEHCKSMRKLL